MEAAEPAVLMETHSHPGTRARARGVPWGVSQPDHGRLPLDGHPETSLTRMVAGAGGGMGSESGREKALHVAVFPSLQGCRAGLGQGK